MGNQITNFSLFYFNMFTVVVARAEGATASNRNYYSADGEYSPPGFLFFR